MAADARDPIDSLSRSYPDFRFSRETIGRRGDRWVARRTNGMYPGLHTVITADLTELTDALADSALAGSGRAADADVVEVAPALAAEPPSARSAR